MTDHIVDVSPSHLAVVAHVRLVTHQNQNGGGQVFLQVINPRFLQMQKGGALREVKYKEDDVGASIENPCNRIKAFLTATVPKLQLVFLSCFSFSKQSSHCCKFCTDGHFMLLFKGVDADSLDDTALANSRIANQDELEGLTPISTT